VKDGNDPATKPLYVLNLRNAIQYLVRSPLVYVIKNILPKIEYDEQMLLSRSGVG
jgi:hypothetical protein